MSEDIQVIAYRDSAPLTQIGLFSSAPKVLDLRGKGFRQVDQVLINGVRSPEFVVLSPRRILAQVPRAQLSARVVSAVVMTATAGLEDAAVISFELAASGGKVATGLVKMVQAFLKLLLTTPGTDIFNPGDGGGLQTVIGATRDQKVNAALAVDRAEEQMIARQASDTRLEDNEKLQSATLESCQFSSSTATLSMSIRLIAMDGSSAAAALNL